MFRYILKILRYTALKSKNSSQDHTSNNGYNEPIPSDLKKSREIIENILHNSSDVSVHEFYFGNNRECKGALLFINSMVDKEEIHKNILQPLMYGTLMFGNDKNLDLSDIDTIKTHYISITDCLKITSLGDLIDNLLAGTVILLVDGSKEALVINTGKRESRNIEEPGTEAVVRGPREGFNENINVSISLIRRKIKSRICV